MDFSRCLRWLKSPNSPIAKSRRNPQRRKALCGLSVAEKLESRALLTIVLTYGGTGTALSLTENGGNADDISISETTPGVLRIQLNGAMFNAASTNAATGLTYETANDPANSSFADINVSTASAITTLDVDLGALDDMLTVATQSNSGIDALDLSGDGGSDTIDVSGLAGGGINVVINGGTGDDVLTGSPNDEEFTPGIGNDTVDGGTGLDTVVNIVDDNQTLDDTSLVVGDPMAPVETDSLTRVEQARLTGGASDNTLDASAFTLGSVSLFGMAGNDVLAGGAGSDNLNGGAGDEDLVRQTSDNDQTLNNVELTGNGTDMLTDIEDANLTGGPSANVIDARNFDTGEVTISGGPGNDEIRGGFNNDLLQGGGGKDTIRGGEGSDTIQGEGGYDLLFGDFGRDRLEGGPGNDTLDGGQSDDVLIGGEKTDVLIGRSGNDKLFGGQGRDHLRGGSGNDTLRGGQGADTLLGGAGNDRLFGQGGANAMKGGSGNDTLVGGGARDTMLGNSGDDLLRGGAGRDVVVGGLGADFVDGQGGFGTVLGGNANGVDDSQGDDTVQGTASTRDETLMDDFGELFDAITAALMGG
ncbi:MAG: hypothetical protein CMJ78_25790 [Planctomycetaceae bacterium]|nr:hypothetical protein [Planctomycetaceae bacterium]